MSLRAIFHYLQIAAARDVRQLVSGITDSARVRYEVGRAVQAEVIRAQLELSNLDHEILGLEGQRAAALARLRYDEGASDLFQVLDAERTMLLAQDRLASGRTAATSGLVTLYRAFGGSLTF